MADSFKQVLYVSQMTSSVTQDDLAALLRQARSLNETHNITGALICVSNNFIQVIEGPKEGIDQLCNNIEADSRNKNFSILIDQIIEKRSFPNWSMGFRTYSLEEFTKEDGFLNINDENGLETIKSHHNEAFEIMRAYYKN